MRASIGIQQALFNLKSLVRDEAARRAVAQLAIREQEGRDADATEAERLADELGQHIQSLLASMELDKHLFMIMEKDGALRFDSIGLEYLEQLGPTGQTAAQQLRPVVEATWRAVARSPLPDDARQWALWCVEGVVATPFAVILARVVWQDVILKQLPRESPQATPSEPPTVAIAGLVSEIAPKYPVVSAVVLRRILGAFLFKEWKLEKVGSETRVVNRRGELLAVVSADVDGDLARVKEMLKGTRSLLGHHLFRYLVQAGVQCHLTVRGHGHRVVVIQGGLSGLATELGIKGSKAATALRPILDGFKYVMLRLPGGRTESLLDWSLELASPGKRSMLYVTLHDALLPDYVNGFPKTTVADREAKKLVPIPVALPPLVHHVRTHSRQALLQLLLLEELNVHAEEVSRSGYATIPWSRWLELAEVLDDN